MTDTLSLLKRLFSGEQLALSRLITLIERRETNYRDSAPKSSPPFGEGIEGSGSKQLGAALVKTPPLPSPLPKRERGKKEEPQSTAGISYLELMSKIQEKCGHAKVVGITGPPGSGKSTLTDQLTFHLRQAGKKVGIVAIDPSSPFSGGAVLGDRIRMQRHSSDEGVFIRSLGSRGSHGGLSRATRDVVKLFDAFGMDFVLVETVGVGQTELDIMEIADTTLVVLTPESGDTIQTMKAGLLEIADIFIVNKSDRSGADRIKADLELMVHLGEPLKSWTVPVLLTQGDKGLGISELLEAVLSHQKQEDKKNTKDDQSLMRAELKEIVLEELREKIEKAIAKHLSGKKEKESNPYQEAEVILKNL